MMIRDFTAYVAKLHGKDSGDPTAYFKIDTLLPSKFVFWEKSTYAYRCQRFYEYDNMNPCAQCHVQWATGDLIGHIWKGYDHLVIVRANLSPVFGFFPTGEDRQESRVSTELMVTVYSDELAGRRPGQDGLVLSEIACGLQSHRLITRKLFQIPLAEVRTPFGKISCSNSDEILASDDEPAVLTTVDVYFPKDLAVQDKILILCAAFTEVSSERYYRSHMRNLLQKSFRHSFAEECSLQLLNFRTTRTVTLSLTNGTSVLRLLLSYAFVDFYYLASSPQ